MERLAHSVMLSWGWKRRGIAFAAGAASALAQPPFFAFPLLWLTFPVLIWLLDGAVAEGRGGRVRRLLPSFAVGWWFGFGYFLAGLWWIGAAFLVEADQFGWLLPVAVLGLPAGLALFWGLGASAARLFWSEDWRRVFALAAGLGGAEWLRGHILTGFPWNAIGYALTGGEVLMQSASLFGVDALNVIAVLIFAAPAVLASVDGKRLDLALPTLALASLAGLGLFGLIRLSHAEQGYVPQTTIRIVQPALDQLQKADSGNRDEIIARYVQLSAPPAQPLTTGTVLVWPETAFPFALTEEPAALAAIGDLLPPGVTLVTGAYRLERSGDGSARVFNTLYTIGDDGTVLDAYDKTHLVPFGEYLPGAGLLTRLGLRQLVAGGFVPGPRQRLLDLPSGPSFAPLICYESIFSGAVLPEGSRAGFLLNVTNDGWFGHTFGPYQHFHQARVRSVEEGLPLVRAANTGISAVIDPFGRIVTATRLGEATMVESRLPIAGHPTFYAEWRGAVLILMLGVTLLVSVSAFIRRPALAYN
jgi:apolipoprotein N-acyltransferase